MISLLCPSRRRPLTLKAMFESAIATADFPHNLQLVCRADSDDPDLPLYRNLHFQGETEDGPFYRLIEGERILLSNLWNEAYEQAEGPIFMHCGDDILFRTRSWDTRILEIFAHYPDNIVFVHGNDLYQTNGLGTHGFIHKRWVDALGYFVPPYFSSDGNDTWLTELADRIDRHVYLTDVITEHMHFAAEKGVIDATHQDRLRRHEDDQVEKLYTDLEPKRIQDAAKLRQAIRER